MFATFITVALFLGIVVKGAVADFTMPTPQLTQCQDTHITWDPTKGPYNLIVVHANDPCGDPVANLGDHSGNSMTWKVTLPAKSSVALTVQDANGDEAWTGDVVVGASQDTSCLSQADLASLKNGTTYPSPSNTPSGTTLTINPSATPLHSSNTGAGAINNAGSNPLSSAALTVRQISSSMLATSVFIGVATLLL